MIDPARSSPDELARAALLLAASETLPVEEHTGVVEEAFRKGDNAERFALLKSLALLPGSLRFLKTATEASRAQVRDVYARDRNNPPRTLARSESRRVMPNGLCVPAQHQEP